MPFARIASNIRSTATAFLLGAWMIAGLTIAARAQEPPPAPTPQNGPETGRLPVLNYSQPVSHFPNPVGPYTPRHVAPPNLANTARIDSLMHDGKIYLSLNDAIALAIENNLDVAIARYNLNIADTDVLRANAGAAILGVNAGVIQNTPGGGVGGIGATAGASTGGTSLGAGGIGAGTNGLVSSTLGLGPPLNSFDPVITGTLQDDHLSQTATSIFQGVLPDTSLVQNTGTVDFAYNQAFHWGMDLSVGFNNSRQTTNSFFSSVSPALNSNFRATITQPILQGLGFAANTRFIRIAKNNRELTDVAFRLQIIDSVDQIENIYWDLVYAYENARVQNESLSFAQKTLSDTKKQVEIGSLAPIETVRAQSTVAQDQQLVTTAQTNLQLEQLLMKNALTRTLKDPVGNRRGHSYFHYGDSCGGTNRSHRGFDQRGLAPSGRTGGDSYRFKQPRLQQQGSPKRLVAHAQPFRLLRRSRRGRESESGQRLLEPEDGVAAGIRLRPAGSPECVEPRADLSHHPHRAHAEPIGEFHEPGQGDRPFTQHPAA